MTPKLKSFLSNSDTIFFLLAFTLFFSILIAEIVNYNSLISELMLDKQRDGMAAFIFTIPFMFLFGPVGSILCGGFLIIKYKKTQ